MTLTTLTFVVIRPSVSLKLSIEDGNCHSCKQNSVPILPLLILTLLLVTLYCEECGVLVCNIYLSVRMHISEVTRAILASHFSGEVYV